MVLNMNRIIQMIPLIFLPFFVSADQGEYRLGSGDLVTISVFDEPDLSMEIRVNNESTLSYPFLGQIEALGKTVKELEAIITRGLLGDYLIEPRVSVSVKEYRPFFISGEVEDPGSYPYQPGLTMQKAISLAGGLTERASRNRMFVVRNTAADGDQEKIEMGDPVLPDDVLSIEQSFF